MTYHFLTLQVQQALRESNEGVTLDLSMRRRTSPPRRASPSPFPTASHPHPQQPPPGSKVAPPQHARPLQPPPEVMVYREGPPGTQGYYHAQVSTEKILSDLVLTHVYGAADSKFLLMSQAAFKLNPLTLVKERVCQNAAVTKINF